MTTASNHEMVDFFKVLNEGGEGLLELRPLKPTSYQPAGRAYVDLHRPHKLIPFVHDHLQDHNFFGVATRLDESSGALENCSTLSVLFADIDFKTTPEVEARRLLAECPLPPSIIIRSGNGLHVYWLLREPLNLQDPGDCALAYSLLGRLCAFLHADEKVAEPAHILRIPGTLNHKYNPPRLVLIETMDVERRYNPSDFEVLHAPPVDAKVNSTFAAPDKILDGERNSTLYKLARSLKAKNLSREAICAALYAENRQKCTPPLLDDEIEQIVESAWTQASRPEFNSLDERLAQILALPLDELKLKWMTFLKGLTAVDRQTVLKEIARLMNVGINTLKQAIGEQQAEAQHKAVAGRIGDRNVFVFYCEDVCAIALQVETAMLARTSDGECVNVNGNVMRAVMGILPHAHMADSDLPAVPTTQLDLMTRAKLLPLVERAVVLQVVTRFGPTPISVPEKVLDQILVNPRQVPTVSGLSMHPLVTTSGRIIAAHGIDPATRLLLYAVQMERLRPYTQAEACEAVKVIARLLLEGFEFATPLDRAAAFAMLLTAVERKLMDMAPGFLVTAAQQSLGKTTFARLTHCVLTGTDAPIFTWPDDDDIEVQKLLLSTLLRSPEIVVFDNIGDGLTFRSPALSSAMTSATKQGRLLGHNRDAVVSTGVVFILTGNNVTLANDEASRIIPIRLTTKEVSPHKRTFKHPDIMRHGLEIRETVLRHVIGLIAGYRASAVRIEAVPSRFPQWDALVRHPLLWAGLEDVGTVFDQNIDDSPELGAHRALLRELQGLFPEGKEFSASALVPILTPGYMGGGAGFVPPQHPLLNEALLALRVKDIKSDRSVGHALARYCGRTAEVDAKVLCLERSVVGGLTRYRVETRKN